MTNRRHLGHVVVIRNGLVIAYTRRIYRHDYPALIINFTRSKSDPDLFGLYIEEIEVADHENKKWRRLKRLKSREQTFHRLSIDKLFNQPDQVVGERTERIARALFALNNLDQHSVELIRDTIAEAGKIPWGEVAHRCFFPQ